MVELQHNHHRLKKIAEESETVKRAAKEQLVLLEGRVRALEKTNTALLSDKQAAMKKLAKMECSLELKKNTKNEHLKRSKKAKKDIENNLERCWTCNVHDAKKKFRIIGPSLSPFLSLDNYTIFDMSIVEEKVTSPN